MENFKINEKLRWPLNDIATGKWNKFYKIIENAPFYFKIQDQSQIIKNIQNELKTNKEFETLYNYQLHFSESLSKTKIWTRNEDLIIPMTLLDVYHALVRHLRDQSFEDQLFNCNEVSFIGPMGPYKEMPLVQCLNEDIIDKLIFEQLVKNKLPARNMRIHTQASVYMECGKNFEDKCDINLRQITNTGLLFSSKNDFLLDMITHGEYLKIFMDTRNLNQIMNPEFDKNKDAQNNFFYTKDELRYFFIKESSVIKSLSYKSGETNEIFLFCRFHDIVESDVASSFKIFLEKMKLYFNQLF